MKPCRFCYKITCICQRKNEPMPESNLYTVDITLKCDLIRASNREELERIINGYLDNLAKQEDESITWSEVDWVVIKEEL